LHLTGTFLPEEDAYINSLIMAARSGLEIEMRRQFATATYRLSLDRFPCGRIIQIPRPPLISVTHIKYQDPADVEITLATTEYGVDIDSEPGRIYSMPSTIWPTTLDIPNAVRITYVAGWPTVDAMPRQLKQLMLIVVADLYTNRFSPSEEGTIDAISYIGQYTRGLKIPTVY